MSGGFIPPRLRNPVPRLEVLLFCFLFGDLGLNVTIRGDLGLNVTIRTLDLRLVSGLQVAVVYVRFSPNSKK